MTLSQSHHTLANRELAPNRSISRRERLNLAVVLVVFMSIAAFAVCACATINPHRERSPTEQYTNSVKLIVTCIETTTAGAMYRVHMGSGVIVSEDVVLTAAHVASCPDGQKMFAETVVMPNESDMYTAETEMLYLQRDVARVKLSFKKLEDVPPVHLGPRPAIGDTICAATAVPDWGRACGVVGPSGSNLTDSINISTLVQFGNSGSGVFDSHGRLIGLVITAHLCQGNFPCSGGVTPIQDMAGLIP